MSSTKGSQFFFWFTEASVEITPKLISVGVSARTAVRLPISTRALNAPVPSSDDIDGLPVVVNQRNNSPCVPRRSTHLATRVRSTSLRPNRRQQRRLPGQAPPQAPVRVELSRDAAAAATRVGRRRQTSLHFRRRKWRRGIRVSAIPTGRRIRPLPPSARQCAGNSGAHTRPDAAIPER